MAVSGRVLVMGATGTVGAGVVAALRARDMPVRAATRDAAAAKARAGRGRADGEIRGVEWVDFDLERPESFGEALAGVEAVFVIARPGDEEPERLAEPLLEAMLGAGVERVVDLSALGAETRADFGLRRVELLLEGSGLAWTHLRPNWFMQIFSTPPLLAAIRARGELAVPAGAARLSFVDARDIAAVAAIVLSQPGHAGAAYTLTGGAGLDHAQVAAEITRASGSVVAYRPMDEDETRAVLARSGLGPQRVERLIGFYRLVRRGACAPVSPDLARVLGRAATSFSDFARTHAGLWRRSRTDEVPPDVARGGE